MNVPKYHEDCECLEICKKIGKTYDVCYKDAVIADRCPGHTRQLLLQQNSQEPSQFSKVVSRMERITLWFIAVGGFVIALIALLCS